MGQGERVMGLENIDFMKAVIQPFALPIEFLLAGKMGMLAERPSQLRAMMKDRERLAYAEIRSGFTGA